MADYDGTIDEIPYAEAQELLDAEAESLLETAREQLRANYAEKGDGWQNESPRFHMWKGQDELFSAVHAMKQGDMETMEERIADGLNHILMASHLAYPGEEG